MGVVDDARDSLRSNSEPDKYVIADTWRDDHKHFGVIEPKHVRHVLREYPGACRTFKMVTWAGHEHVAGDRTYTRAEHAGRVEVDSERIVETLSDGEYTCRVRLDTSDPQLVAIENERTEAEIEVDDSIVCWVPRMEDRESD